MVIHRFFSKGLAILGEKVIMTYMSNDVSLPVQLVAVETDPADFGPAMQALNPRQQAFVIALLEQPSANQTLAARAAGYSEASCRQQGYLLFHNEKVKAAMREEATRRLSLYGSMAVDVLKEIAWDRTEENKVRLKAAVALMDRSGFNPRIDHHVTHHDDPNDRALQIKRLATLAKELGVAPRVLLGTASDITDAEFEIIEPPKEEAVMSVEGIEDVLGVPKDGK